MNPDARDMSPIERKLVESTSGVEFLGLEGHHATAHLTFSGDGHTCIAWTLRAQHGQEARITRARIQGRQTFLGWHETGRQVEIPVVSVCRSNDPMAANAGDWHHHWDRLGALAQIGVRAVGRPVLRADNALDVPES
ncbi:MAG: hypothetical protein M9925_15550 [Chloroflexi bacterium]|nr:hypothetical protein [Dehalococcoidia bacterium]MCO5203107.1 hypothetical protein [Chloroflexota bacterium]NJD10909.1 hypothetical protein [Gemmatimonadota bacterium]PWB44198.1 MAG: hypothetical protein C3F10_09585 [Dehalococcoidia bacterium]